MASSSAIRAGRAFVEMGLDDQKLRQQMSAVHSRMQSFGSSLTKVFAGFAGGFAVTRVFDTLLGQLKKLDDLLDTSSKIGVAAGELQEFQHAAVRTGSSVEALNTALVRMQKTISEAGSGSKLELGSLAELGLSPEKLSGLSPAERFREIADAFKGIKNEADQIRLAMEVFGKGGADIVDTLRQGASGLKQLANEARSLGGVLTEQQEQAAARATEAIEKLEARWEGLKNSLATGLPGQMLTAGMESVTTVSSLANEAFNFVTGNIAEPVGSAPRDPAKLYQAAIDTNNRRQYLQGKLGNLDRQKADMPWWNPAGAASLEVEIQGVAREIGQLDANMKSILAAWNALPEKVRETARALGGGTSDLGIGAMFKAIGGAAGGVLGAVPKVDRPTNIFESYSRSFGNQFAAMRGAFGLLPGAGGDGGIAGWREAAAQEAADHQARVGEASALTESLRTPQERMDADFLRVADLFADGFIDSETFDRFNEQMNNATAAFEQLQDVSTRLPDALVVGTQGAAEAILRATFGGTNNRVDEDQLGELRGIRRAAEETNRRLNNNPALQPVGA